MESKNISINDSGMLCSGEYDRILICGEGFGTGIIKANRLEVNGNLNFDGKIECQNMLVNGSVKTSSISSSKLKINGKIICDSIESNSILICSSNDCSINSIKSDKFVAHTSKAILHKIKNKSIITVHTVECKNAEVTNLHSDQIKCISIQVMQRTNIDKLICEECNVEQNAIINQIVYLKGDMQ